MTLLLLLLKMIIILCHEQKTSPEDGEEDDEEGMNDIERRDHMLEQLLVLLNSAAAVGLGPDPGDLGKQYEETPQRITRLPGSGKGIRKGWVWRVTGNDRRNGETDRQADIIILTSSFCCCLCLCFTCPATIHHQVYGKWCCSKSHPAGHLQIWDGKSFMP